MEILGKRSWYKEMTVYQIWPRSFCDSDGDGIGDLGGIMSKLPYLADLGIDAIWFSPLFKSPNADYGYDISDYRDIHEEYGTLEQFKEMLRLAHSLEIKVIMDLVINHSSSEHYWFQEACKSRDNQYHDYYIWREGKGKDKKKVPNNWTSNFPGSTWEYVEAVDQFYLHLFDVGQPDLNHDNPKLREEIKDIMRFWLDMGVDGFREDVITYISKPDGLPNGFPLPISGGIEKYNNGPHIHEYFAEYKKVQDEYDAVTIGEAAMLNTKKAIEYTEEGSNQRLNMMFNFEHMGVDGVVVSWIKRKFKLTRLKKIYERWQTELYPNTWNTLYLENHDQPRIINRLGSLEYHNESAKMLATMYMLMRGTPFVYQGQEIGMTNIKLDTIEEYKDICTHTIYNLARKFHISNNMIMKRIWYSARDNARTPVQWTAGENAGFTTGEPWFVVNPNYKEINVEQNMQNKNSILNYYKKLIEIRKQNEVIIYGDYKQHYKKDKSLYVYERTLGGDKLLVVCSFDEKAHRFDAPAGINLQEYEMVLSNYDTIEVQQNGFTTKPYGATVFLSKKDEYNVN